LVLAGCGTVSQPEVVSLPEIVTPTQNAKPAWSVKSSDSKGVSVLKWNATITNTDKKDATDLSIGACDVNNKVLAADMIRITLKVGETKEFSGTIDVVDEDVFKLHHVVVYLIYLDQR